jgi:hypothetical protein
MRPTRRPDRVASGRALDSAADEGLTQYLSRFLRFRGHEGGDVIELQTLGVPNKYGTINESTHVKTVEKAIDALEGAPLGPPAPT